MTRTLLLVTALFFAAGDMASLRREFDAKKVEVNRRRRNERKKAIEKELVPVLKKIAALKNDEAVSFLANVVQTEMPDLAAAACRSLAATGKPQAVDILLKAARNRPPQVREAALDALRGAKIELSEAQTAQVRSLLTGKSPPKIRKAAARILGAQDSLPAAKALLEALRSRRIDDELAATIETELKRFKKKEVLDFFFKEALAGGVKSPRQLVALLHVAAEKKSRDAYEAAQKLLDHRSAEVSAAAVTTLAALGFKGGSDQIYKLLRKWRGKLEPALDLLVGLAESKSAEASRILVGVSRKFSGPIAVAALSLLGRAQSEEALSRLIEALEDKDVAVRTAAMKAIQQYKDKRIIGPLIGLMERENGRLKGEAYKFLVRITGQSMGPVADNWRKWWSYAQKNFTFKPRRGGRTTVRGAAYYGIEIFSKQICFIIDCSSSMRQKVTDPKTNRQSTRIELAKKELIKTLKELKGGTMVNIISFNSSYHPMARQLTPLTSSGRRRAIKYVQNLKTGVGTNIYDTLSAALKDRRVDTIFLLSDGQPSRGKYTDPGAILREIRKQNLVRNVTINTIAIGIELDFMKELAKQNGGTYVFVKD